MVKQILRRVKVLLGLTDSSDDEKLVYLIEGAILQIESYIHSSMTQDLIPVAALLVSHNYTSGEGEGSGGGAATIGEVKKESYSGVSFEYTTSADFASSSSKSEATTYFDTMIAPMLKGKRKIQTICHQL